MTVGELTARMPMSEVREWMAVDRIRAAEQGRPVTAEDKIAQGLAEQAEAGLATLTRMRKGR